MPKPLLMGVLNVTPDSFSDGGMHFENGAAIEAGLRMVAEGADIIDVGGESTRPGAQPVSLEVELGRVLPVVSALASHGLRVSIDTMKPGVARAALRAGAQIVNDVSGLRSPEMIEVCAAAQCTVCIMHMKGEPRTMQQHSVYPHGVVKEVGEYLDEACHKAQSGGIAKDRIWVDPGIGFGKTSEQNLVLLRELRTIVDLGYPVVIGVSRKSFIGKILGSPENPLPHSERLEGSLALQVWAQIAGVTVIRTHDVTASLKARDVLGAMALQMD